MLFKKSQERQRSSRKVIPRATFNIVRELLENTIVKQKKTEAGLVNLFHSNTVFALVAVLLNIGFDPKIYVEPYNDEFDFWKNQQE